jgi:hypothetical protein
MTSLVSNPDPRWVLTSSLSLPFSPVALVSDQVDPPTETSNVINPEPTTTTITTNITERSNSHSQLGMFGCSLFPVFDRDTDAIPDRLNDWNRCDDAIKC